MSKFAAVPIVSTHLEDKYGFECKVDYDKDFATDEYYSLKIATYKKKIVGNLEIHITDRFKFVEAPDTYKYQSTTVEIVQGTEFQEIKIDKMWQLLMLIDMLQGVQWHSSERDADMYSADKSDNIMNNKQNLNEPQNQQLNIAGVRHSANFHAKAIIKKLTSRPYLDDDGFYDMIADEEQMIEIIEKYLERHYV